MSWGCQKNATFTCQTWFSAFLLDPFNHQEISDINTNGSYQQHDLTEVGGKLVGGLDR